MALPASAVPSAPLARKQLLNALDEKIIPLTGAAPRLVWGKPPFVLPPGVTVRALPMAPLSSKRARRGQHALDLKWPAARMNSLHLPYFAIVYDGEADLRVGTTVEQARALRRRSADKTRKVPGGHVLSVPALSVVVFPPGVPYSDGSGVHWERAGAPHLRIFWMHILPGGAYCHLCRNDAEGHVGEFPLLVKDARLPIMAETFMEELRERANDYEEIAQAQLLALLRRLRRRLALDPPTLYNTARNLFDPVAQDDDGSIPASRALGVLAQVDRYLEQHLTETVSIEQMTRAIGLSPTHLNRLVRAAAGTSLMRYVTRRRLEAARHMLVRTDLAVQETARLCGYAQVSHFCQAFRREFGVTPRQLRRDDNITDGWNP